MALPKPKEIELPLLYEIEKAGGAAKPKDIYDKVAAHFPGMTAAERAETVSSGPNRFNNRITWVLSRLKDKGELSQPSTGIWTITDKGRERLRKEWKEGGPSSQPAPSAPPPLSPVGPAPVQPEKVTILELLEEQNRSFRTQLRQKLMELTPAQFEQFAGRLLEKLGFQDVQVTGRAGDGGIDGHGKLEMGIVRVEAAFQVKRWQQNVPRPEIDKFRGAIQGQFDQGIFITTSDFTEDAKQASTRPGTVPIVMINGDKIIDIALEQKLGIKTEPLTITRVDEEFFTGLVGGSA